jgi:2-polyprenyl-3-methyl-5-hydroxy-6-metoxy-1,4-benzoquinol methylase
MELAEYQKMDELEKKHPWFIAKRNFLISELKGVLVGKERILDIGCGTGAVMKLLSEKGYQVDGVDSSDEAIGYCRDKELKVQLGSAEETSFDSESFDVVLALDVLEHLSDDGLGVKEMARVLKAGGTAIITVPAHASLFSIHDQRLQHYRRYSRNRLIGLFEEGEWEIKKVSWIHCLILLPVALGRLLSKANLSKKESSDVNSVNGFLSKILNSFYSTELFFYNIFGTLPFGLSLLIVVQKKKHERDN